MAELAILKRTYEPSDEVLCERWIEGPLLPVLLPRGGSGVRPLLADVLAPASEDPARLHRIFDTSTRALT